MSQHFHSSQCYAMGPGDTEVLICEHRPAGSLALSFELEGYRVNKPGAWRRLYGKAWGYYRDFGWRACFLGGGE